MDVCFNLKEPGEVTDGITFLKHIHWQANPTFQHFHSYSGWMALVQELIETNYRAEGLVVGVDGTVLAATIWMPVTDMHYGDVAYPIAHMIDPFWRGNVDMLRAVSKLRRQCVKSLGTEWYLDVKHVSDREQRQRLRSINE